MSEEPGKLSDGPGAGTSPEDAATRAELYRHDRRQIFWLAVICFMVALLATVGMRRLTERRELTRVARVQSDLRSLATAIESYYVDNMTYPPSDWQDNVDGAAAPLDWPRTSTFRSGAGLSTLTTPVAYIAEFPADPFASASGVTYRYLFRRAPQWIWIAGSFGPDRDQDVGGDLQWQGTIPVFSSANPVPPEMLAGGEPRLPGSSYTFDPTNGIISEGDIWRMKQ